MIYDWYLYLNINHLFIGTYLLDVGHYNNPNYSDIHRHKKYRISLCLMSTSLQKNGNPKNTLRVTKHQTNKHKETNVTKKGEF